ncbi:hypothetical protein [Parvibium lacunae]|uniref:Nuclear transport factor 2 family protein n=1 Tax=Parvibium lacunae TaxID=1888893 RepID=A0A368KYF6_9BURK|nr:hypothetical protein [Parvibium lacunae]RCS56480.1 hypothetical protein DU000_12190 [Parvibium lacunae]
MALANWIETYIAAKDHNRPHLMAQAFLPDAELQMDVQTGIISFPAQSLGEAAITQVLVRDFGTKYENVYTFCVGERPQAHEANYRCQWLVVMSDKATGEARIGCGEYEWVADAERVGVQRLIIVIKHMEVLPPVLLAPILAWATQLSYPWTHATQIAVHMPNDPAYAAVRRYLLPTA